MRDTATTIDNRDKDEIISMLEQRVDFLKRTVETLQAEIKQLRYDNRILVAENAELQGDRLETR